MIQISTPTGRTRHSTRHDTIGPRLQISLSVTLDCELLEGEVPNLGRIAEELAAYLERRDQHIGMIAASEWALLIRQATVRNEDVTLDVEPRRSHH